MLSPSPDLTQPPRWLAYGFLALSMSLVGSYVALSKPLVAALPALALTIALLAPSTARAQSPFPSDDDKPKLAAVLVGFRTVWRSSGSMKSTDA